MDGCRRVSSDSSAAFRFLVCGGILSALVPELVCGGRDQGTNKAVKFEWDAGETVNWIELLSVTCGVSMLFLVWRNDDSSHRVVVFLGDKTT